MSASTRRLLIENERSALTARITGTPNFKIGRTGDVLVQFDGRGLGREDFVRRVSAELNSSSS